MGSRTIPYHCPHGAVLDWGDHGPDPDDGTVGADHCRHCSDPESAVLRLADRIRARWAMRARIGREDPL